MLVISTSENSEVCKDLNFLIAYIIKYLLSCNKEVEEIFNSLLKKASNSKIFIDHYHQIYYLPSFAVKKSGYSFEKVEKL